VPSITAHRRRSRFAGLPPADRRALGTTGRAVCDRAGLNPRCVDEGFADLDQLRSQVLTMWIEGHRDVAREQLVEDLTELFVAVCDGVTMVARQRRAGAGS
jgi:hypothetical protein